MLAPVPRRYSPFGFVELSTRLDGDRVILEPGGFSLRFAVSQLVLFLVFFAIGASLAYFVRRAGTLVSAWMCVMATMGWAPLALMLTAAAINARAGGALCVYDRRTRTFEAPREGIRLSGSTLEELCYLKFDVCSANSRSASITFTSQLLCAVRDASGERHVIPLALSCRPASAARRFAQACGAEFTKGSAPSQDQQVWQRAPDWTFARSSGRSD